MDTVLFFVSSDRHSCRDRLEGICRRTNDLKWHVQVVERSFNPTDVRSVLDFWRPIGVIAECGSGADELGMRSFGRIPVVWFDADSSGRRAGWFVGSDSRAVSAAAAAELLRLGLRNFAYVSFRRPLRWNALRRDAFVQAIGAEGHACEVFDPGKELSPAERRRRLSAWIGRLPQPCGVFAANDYVGEEVLAICQQLGRSVPHDIAVIGVDDDKSICENTNPTLSSIAPDFVAGGELAARMLEELIGGSRVRRREEFFGVAEIVNRCSTRRIDGADPRVMRALDFIARCACQGISVDDVVAAMGCSRRLAQQRFQAATGHGIITEITNVRMQRVVGLLRNPRQSLDAVAGLAGYDTGAALRKAFKLRTGLSMSEWRRRELAQG